MVAAFQSLISNSSDRVQLGHGVGGQGQGRAGTCSMASRRGCPGPPAQARSSDVFPLPAGAEMIVTVRVAARSRAATSSLRSISQGVARATRPAYARPATARNPDARCPVRSVSKDFFPNGPWYQLTRLARAGPADHQDPVRTFHRPGCNARTGPAPGSPDLEDTTDLLSGLISYNLNHQVIW